MSADDPFRTCCWPNCTVTIEVPRLFCDAHLPRVRPETLSALRTALSVGDIQRWREMILGLDQ